MEKPAVTRQITHTDISQEFRTIRCRYTEPLVIGDLDRSPLTISLGRIEREDEAEIDGHSITTYGHVVHFDFARSKPGIMKGEVRIPKLQYVFEPDVEYRFPFVLTYSHGAPIIHGPW